MSTPARTGRTVVPQAPGRPTRPVQRTPPARSNQPRSNQPRSSLPKSGQPRPSPSRTSLSRATRSSPPAARTATRGGSSAATATVGATALALLELPRPSGAGLAGSGRTRMRVLEQPRTTGRRAGFVLTCTATLGALMLGLLLLNVAISGNAFTVAELQSQRGVLRDQQQALEQQLLVQGSPSSLSSRARGLGMVPAPQVIVLAPDATGAPPVAPAP